MKVWVVIEKLLGSPIGYYAKDDNFNDVCFNDVIKEITTFNNKEAAERYAKSVCLDLRKNHYKELGFTSPLPDDTIICDIILDCWTEQVIIVEQEVYSE